MSCVNLMANEREKAILFSKAHLQPKNTRFPPESQKFSKDIFLASGSILVYSNALVGMGFHKDPLCTKGEIYGCSS